MPQSDRKSLLAQLPSQCFANPDEKMRFFVDWWQRMHTEPHLLVAESVKLVEWTEEGATAQRFLWEVCLWAEGASSLWTFVCWMIDGEGMWMKHFPSKEAATAYFEQPPAVVMAPASHVDDENPAVGIKVRRAS